MEHDAFKHHAIPAITLKFCLSDSTSWMLRRRRVMRFTIIEIVRDFDFLQSDTTACIAPFACNGCSATVVASYIGNAVPALVARDDARVARLDFKEVFDKLHIHRNSMTIVFPVIPGWLARVVEYERIGVGRQDMVRSRHHRNTAGIGCEIDDFVVRCAGQHVAIGN
ncbi:MAG: hypothetical protein AUI84_15140 [Delftia sp. 13_1_40CM_3_66_6]|nr:MAG: hypothetical protein AUI84_15140 [Delftia sp. 13_1_40CM_3_66_6]